MTTLRRWAGARPVTAFLVILFSVAYPVTALPILADHGVLPGGSIPQKLGIDAEEFASLLLILALLPAALFVTWAADGRDGVRTLLGRAFRWRIGVGWWLVVLAALPTLALAFALLLGDSLRQIDVTALVIGQVTGLLVNLLLINIWEETGWAGVVQTRLERRHSLVVAALLTAVPFAFIHMPLQFIGAFSIGSLVTGLVALLVICSIVRLLIGVVLRGARDSVLAVAVLHTTFNRSNNDDGIVASLVDGESRGPAALLATVVLAAAIAVVARRRLGRSYRLTLDGVPNSGAVSPTREDEKDDDVPVAHR